MKKLDLAQIPLFNSLPPDELDQLAAILRLVEFTPGAVLFYEGHTGDRFSIIVEGEVDVVKAMDTPDERILAIIGPGEFLGEMSLLYRDRMRSASARTRTTGSLLEMTHAEFHNLLRRRPELAFHVMQEMSLRLRNSEDATIRDLQQKNRELANAYRELQLAQAQLIEKEKLEHELRMARSIQESSLPKEVPVLPGWEFSAYWQPARSVSGDFYDFFPLADGNLAIVVGDVTGKGVPSALVMATTRSVLRTSARQTSSPGAILSQVNELVQPEMPEYMFVTCLCAVLNFSTGHLQIANAGHNLPYRVGGRGVQELRVTGMPLGLLPGMSYEEVEWDLQPGDTLLLYSDGLVEAHSPDQGMYGFPRLAAQLGSLQASGITGEEMIGALIADLAVFTGSGWEQEDDVTFVTVFARISQSL